MFFETEKVESTDTKSNPLLDDIKLLADLQCYLLTYLN
jgi:hypothetical protein